MTAIGGIVAVQMLYFGLRAKATYRPNDVIGTRILNGRKKGPFAQGQYLAIYETPCRAAPRFRPLNANIPQICPLIKGRYWGRIQS